MVQSLCKEDATTASQVSIPWLPAAHGEDVKLSHEMLAIAENEILVSEIVRKHHGFSSSIDISAQGRHQN